MGKTFVADIQESVLQFTSADSDWFVYSNYFMPVQVVFPASRTPILPFYTKNALLDLEASGMMTEDRIREILREHVIDDLWERNQLDAAREHWSHGRVEPERLNPGGENGHLGDLREPVATLEMLSERLAGADRDVATGLVTRLRELGESGELTLVSLARPTPSQVLRASVIEKRTDEIEFLQRVIFPDLGFVFLDRTRITPVGFALGEHLFALGLGPGETVVLEQKSLTKRQLTTEEATEQEKQFDLELASTYSTELQEGLEHQRSNSDSWGLTAGLSGQYTSPMFEWGQITASPSVSYSKNVSAASQDSNRWSIKDNQTASSKVAARYRAEHRVTFKLASKETFETSSKRTIHNPNQTTPITLHYFKVLQRLRMKQERYGVRLCWTVGVKDPGASFYDKLVTARQRYVDEAMKRLPPPPVEPAAPPAGDGSASTQRETKIANSQVIAAEKWNASGDMSAEYDADVPIPDGFTWDQVPENVNITVFSKRPDSTISRWVVGRPYPIDGNSIRVRVHIGAPSWIAGPGITFQVSALTLKDVTVTENATEDTKYADDLTMYRTALKDWQSTRDTMLAEAQEAADAHVRQLKNGLSPVSEMVSQIIEQHFHPSVRDEMWEIDYWQRLFDWERATFTAFPSWWSGTSSRDPLLDPSDFLNASWAKLFLPAKLGMERAVLRWVLGKSVAAPLEPATEQAIDNLMDDLKAYRTDVLGGEDEIAELTKDCQEIGDTVRCLGTWYELIPTDGTHIEVIQSMSSAADPITAQEIADAAELRKALLAKESASAAITGKAETLMSEPAHVAVRVGDGSDQNR